MRRVKDMLTAVVVANREMLGEAELGRPLREQLIAELEGCLVDEERLEGYLATLEEVLEGRARYLDDGFIGNPKQFDAVCENGFTALDDASLVRTALNPGVLRAMADLLDDDEFVCEEDFSQHWTAVFAQFGRELLEQDKISPSFHHSLDQRVPIQETGVASEDGRSVQRFSSIGPPSARDPRLREKVRAAARGTQSTRGAQGDVAATTPLVIFRRFTSNEREFDLLHDTENKVYVAAPETATHFEVRKNIGMSDQFRLLESKHSGLRLVEGITRPRLRRLMESGESVGFVTIHSQTENR
jgi:hypothetical protein